MKSQGSIWKLDSKTLVVVIQLVGIIAGWSYIYTGNYTIACAQSFASFWVGVFYRGLELNTQIEDNILIQAKLINDNIERYLKASGRE